MTDGGSQTRLSAILAADVVGYTQRMEQDSNGTVAAWVAARETVIDPIISSYAGRIVKHTGDGFLAEFQTVQNAVECAVAMQAGLKDNGLEFRMGVNLGDIIDDGEDIHGEGVNIAARIEALAEPGGICISGPVYESVRNRIDVVYEDLGEKTVKHVTAPVRVYAIQLAEATEEVPEALPLPDRPSIAVLAFDNMSGDPEQDYFSDGIAEDITTELSRFDSIFVISRNSAFAYKGKQFDIRDVGRELGVEYILEGSVRRSGDRLRVTVQLITTADNNHAWAERYDRQIDDIFAIQDEITETVVSTLVGRIEKINTDRAKAKQTDNLTAYDYLLKGLDVHKSGNITPERARFAFDQISTAVELSPTFARAHAWRACSWANTWPVPVSESDLLTAMEWTEKALELDPDEAESHRISGAVNRYLGNFDKADYHVDRAVALNGNNAHVVAKAAEHHCYMGRLEKAEELILRAMRINPHFPDWYWEILGIVKYHGTHLQDAHDCFVKTDANSVAGLMYGGATLQEMGEQEKARDHVARLIDVMPKAGVGFFRDALQFNCYQDPAKMERVLKALKAAGLPD